MHPIPALWLVTITALLFLVACRESKSAKALDSRSAASATTEPDYGQIIDDLRVEAALQAMRSEDDSFKEVDSAGAPDTLAWFRRNLVTLDLSLFKEDPEIEGILFVGGRLRFTDAGSGGAQVQTLSIIEGRCGLMTDKDDVSVSAARLIDALRSRSEQRPREEPQAKIRDAQQDGAGQPPTRREFE